MKRAALFAGVAALTLAPLRTRKAEEYHFYLRAQDDFREIVATMESHFGEAKVAWSLTTTSYELGPHRYSRHLKIKVFA